VRGSGGDQKVSSAGTWITDGHLGAQEAMRYARQLGLYIQGHTSTLVSAEIIMNAALIVVADRLHIEALCSEFADSAYKVQLFSNPATETRHDLPEPADSSGVAGVGVEIVELIPKSLDWVRTIVSVKRCVATRRVLLQALRKIMLATRRTAGHQSRRVYEDWRNRTTSRGFDVYHQVL
jgi:protein-tyrosine-phosphatase